MAFLIRVGLTIVALACFGLMPLAPSFAEGQPAPPKERAHQNSMQTFFRHRSVEAVVKELAAYPEEKLSKKGAALISGAFLAHLINADPAVGEMLIKQISGISAAHKAVVANALSFSDHPRRNDLLRQLVGPEEAAKMGVHGLDFRTMKIVNPIQLDFLWMSFFATGDAGYVGRIADTLHLALSDDKLANLVAAAKEKQNISSELLNALIGKAAAWSLTVNCRDYPEVRAALAAYAESTQATGLATEILRKTAPK